MNDTEKDAQEAHAALMALVDEYAEAGHVDDDKSHNGRSAAAHKAVDAYARTLTNRLAELRLTNQGLIQRNVLLSQRQAVQEPVAQISTEEHDEIGITLLAPSLHLPAGTYALYTAAPQPAQVPEWDEPRIHKLAADMAAKVAKNASTAPQLCFPDIYLSLRDALLGVPQLDTVEIEVALDGAKAD